MTRPPRPTAGVDFGPAPGRGGTFSLDDLQAFLVVARTKSFSAAALRLRIAQSSLSKRVQRLEQHFGTELFVRHGRGVRLTESGSVLLGRSEKLQAEIENIEQDVRGNVLEASGLVRIAMPPATGPVVAPLVIARCMTEHPKVTLQLRESTSNIIHQWLAAGEVDIALMYDPEPGTDIEIHPLVTEPLCLLAPAQSRVSALMPFDYPEVCTLDDLARLPLILPRSPHSIRVIVERLCAGNSIQPRVVCESDSIRSTKGIIEIGIGCTIFGRSSLMQEIAENRLRAIPFSSALLSWTLCLAHPRRDNLSPALHSVKRIMIDRILGLHRAGFWPGGRAILGTKADSNQGRFEAR